MWERVLLILAGLAVASAVYWWWSRRQGVVRNPARGERLRAEDLDAPLGGYATFIQFSTPMCAKCPGTARLLTSVAAEQPQVRHVEIDASVRVELARQYSVMRTPTTLVLDGDGYVVARMNGAPTPAQARDALARVPAGPGEYSI